MKRGDIYLVSLDPTEGHEQRGRRPVLVVSPAEFNDATKLPVIVGFNRRYAPLVLEMKKRLQEMDGPFVLNYRVNAGFVPASKWSQDPNLGGGRVIHECCHFFDLFNFLLGQSNPRIVADSAGVSGSNSVARDNISVSLRYPNGSSPCFLVQGT